MDDIKKQLLQDKEFLTEIEKAMVETSCREVEKAEQEDSDNLDTDKDIVLTGMLILEGDC